MLNSIKNLSSLTETKQSHNETIPCDLEISRRVRLIQSQWSNEEREKRREAAQRRLNDLLDTLTGPAA
ncbi:MAG: hypothetical protein VX694_16690 [Planctomycetota bacterium]|nr:hypothetical protein [Planctomycetota bacterium]MEC7680913.1 hypothetical protein [Planctomycetota bacterium]MEC8475202.1 hypothetical protein [Planctomycetota bacterium]